VGGNVTGSVGSVVGLTVSNLDATVSSRLPTSSYTSPDNANVSLIKAKTDLIPADPATVTNQTTILNRLGAFTGTGLNTILGFFRAIMRKDASLTPTDAGGTYDNVTDSLEAQQDSKTEIFF
jgi:hypothetical protein